MSQVLQLKRDPAWLKSLPFIAGTVILLQGDDRIRQVSVPAALLIASSPMVRNILSSGHLPPAFSTPVISFPCVSVDILERVGEMLVFGIASVNLTRLSGVREVLKMIGIEDWMISDIESVVKDFDNEDTVRDLVRVKGQLDLELDVKLEIVVKVEKESDAENAIFLFDQTTGQSSEEPHSIARLTNSVNLEEHFEKSTGHKEKTKKQNLSSNIIQEKYSRRTKKSCPHCEKKILWYNLDRHISAVHNKEKVQCPQCNKTLGISSVSNHIRAVHNKVTVKSKRTCPQCDKKFVDLSKHIRHVHSMETAQCPHCEKTLRYSSLARHVDTFHKED